MGLSWWDLVLRGYLEATPPIGGEDKNKKGGHRLWVRTLAGLFPGSHHPEAVVFPPVPPAQR